MQLYELKKGDKFRIRNLVKKGDWPKDSLLTFLGMDGMYGKVRADDVEVNRAACARYDANSDFFAIAAWTTVVPICETCGHFKDHEACNGRIE